MSKDFWDYLHDLIDTSQIVIDRPKGSIHPRFPNTGYPVDYGYLNKTTSIDGSGVDIWVGSLEKNIIVGVLCTVDLLKRDSELKIIYNCTEDEIHSIVNYVNMNQMRAIFIARE
jgi:inorganic pyrophosphatase